jgi:hypothetical protein
VEHEHDWKRLFTRPDDSDGDRRLSYVLAGWERIFVCASEGCGVIAKRAYRTGRMHALLMQDEVRKRADDWNREERALKEGRT